MANAESAEPCANLIEGEEIKQQFRFDAHEECSHHLRLLILDHFIILRGFLI